MTSSELLSLLRKKTVEVLVEVLRNVAPCTVKVTMSLGMLEDTAQYHFEEIDGRVKITDLETDYTFDAEEAPYFLLYEIAVEAVNNQQIPRGAGSQTA